MQAVSYTHLDVYKRQVSEMVNMITISRAYQAGQKVINTIDETLDKAVNQVGNV